jgi:CBS-domain-containing membrane protein
LPEDASVEEALAAMRAGGVRRLPVVGGDGSLVGIVSLDDVIAQLARDVAAVGSFLEQRVPERIATD